MKIDFTCNCGSNEFYITEDIKQGNDSDNIVMCVGCNTAVRVIINKLDYSMPKGAKTFKVPKLTISGAEETK